jgi:hypothetical protein
LDYQELKMAPTQTDRNSIAVAGQGSPARHSWPDFVLLYPMYASLARLCESEKPPYATEANPSPWPNEKQAASDFAWLDQVDRKLQAVHIRQFLATPSAAREEGLRALLRRHLFKPDKTSEDRDKIDLLVVQYFALCAPHELMAALIDLADVARVLQPVLGEVEIAELECCEPLDVILETAQQCRTLSDFMDQGLVEKGRIAKENAGGMFYDPAALVTFCRFNFLLRRIFIQLLHAELRTLGQMLTEVEKRGVTHVDCRRAGFSASEPSTKLRDFHTRWKFPFHRDYSQGGASKPFEQLMSLRADLEDALNPGPASAARGNASTPEAQSRGSQADTRQSGDQIHLNPESPSPFSTIAKPPAPSSKQRTTFVSNSEPKASGAANDSPTNARDPQARVPNVSEADLETCEEKIWEQLIATPPVRGRSMTTVTVEGTRILLSAWEVAAFVSDSGPTSEDVRKAIVARAMLGMAIERRKQFVDVKILHQALAHARSGIRHFQESIDQLKRGKKIDAAVNLSISLKRLLSLAEEAEQLQSGSVAGEEKR